MNVVLIDDEQIALDFLHPQLQKRTHVHIIGTYVNPEAEMRTILEEVDAVFLDIHMPRKDVNRNAENT